MEDNTHYKSISKKEKDSITEICNYDTYSDFLKVFAKRKEYYEITLAETYVDGSEAIFHYIEGKLQEPEGEKVEPTPSGSNIDLLEELLEELEKLSKAAPSRKDNPLELLYDSMVGEDISKPKLKVIKGDKE